MKRSPPITTLIWLFIVSGVAGGSYWLGQRSNLAPSQPSSSTSLAEPSPPIKTTTAADTTSSPNGQKADASQGPGKILYYRNPMGLADTSPVPKKDSMGMDYVPVYADGVDASGTVQISPDKVQKLGVRTEMALERPMTRTIRAVGVVAADERRLAIVNAKFEGWIEKLYVNTTGQTVKRGEPMAEVYSPDLVLAEQEYLIARQALDGGQTGGDASIQAASQAIADAALQRFRNWDLSPDQLIRNGKVTRTLMLRAPMAGQVLDKQAILGMRFGPGETLFKLADLSSVWVVADVFEQDLALVHPGEDAKISIKAYPGQTFSGRVDFIYPTISAETRTAKIRIQVPNKDGLLKTDMYATVELVAPLAATAQLAIPESAVLDTGTRQVVLIERDEGRYAPQEVKLGVHSDGYVVVEKGLTLGDNVVVGANFLIDAESNLRAALQTFTAPPQGGTTP